MPRLRSIPSVLYANTSSGREPTIQESVSSEWLAYVEIGGHWGGDYEHYDAAELNRLFAAYGVRCSGVCGLFYNGNTLSSPDRFIRNRAKEYIAHELDLCQAIGATYLLVVPGTTGQYTAFDTCDFERSAKALGDMAGNV